MPETPEETVISSNLLDELKNERLAKQEMVEEKEKNEEEKDEKDELDRFNDTTQEGIIDKSFYTRSMDLKKEDLMAGLDSDDEFDDSFKEDSKSIGKIIFIIILIMLLLGVIGYFVYTLI